MARSQPSVFVNCDEFISRRWKVEDVKGAIVLFLIVMGLFWMGLLTVRLVGGGR